MTATGRAWRDTLELTEAVPYDGAVPALAYRSVVGTPEVGDDVLLNTTAWAQGLGTGGYAMVVAVPDRLPPDPAGAGRPEVAVFRGRRRGCGLGKVPACYGRGAGDDAGRLASP